MICKYPQRPGIDAAKAWPVLWRNYKAGRGLSRKVVVDVLDGRQRGKRSTTITRLG